MHQIRFLLCIFLLCSARILPAQDTVSVTEFGAVPGTDHNNAPFIQKAIDALAVKGKGRVVIPAGFFRSGPLYLKSGVNLYLDSGAVLAGSTNRMDYGSTRHLALINGYGLRDISIQGKGIIDGQGRALIADIYKRLEAGEITDSSWKTKRPGEQSRTNLFYFENCTGISVRGLLLKDATTWVTHYARCRNIVIDGVQIESTAYWNNDGIDLVDCHNVQIRNCSINSSDDGICLKSEDPDDYCDSILVENCRIRSSANAFKTGTSSRGGFRNITVNGLTVYDTYRSAIALEAVDGGFLENVQISNIVAKHTGNALFIKLGHRNTDGRYSAVKHIHITNLTVVVPAGKPDSGYETEGPLLKYPPGYQQQGSIQSVSPWNHSYPDSTAVLYPHNVFPCSLSGLPGHPLEDIVLENLRIVYEGGGDATVQYMPLDSLSMLTEAAAAYPEFSMFGELPAWGLYVRHVKNLQLHRIELIQQKPDYRVACIFDDVKGLVIDRLQVSGPQVKPALVLYKATRFTLKEISTPLPQKETVQIR